MHDYYPPAIPRAQGEEETVRHDFHFSKDLMLRLLEDIYRGEAREIDREVWEMVTEVFNSAVKEGFGEPEPADRFFQKALEYNNAVFAAFRSHAMQEEITRQLTNGEGELKTFRDFRSDVEKYIEPTWLDSWLKTEYHTAVNRAHMAAIFRRAQRDRDVLPNLKWMPSTSIRPGEDHRVFWSTVRPVDDPFWEKHRPGDRWNCKCDLEPTDDPVTEAPPGEEGDKPIAGLENNTAKDAKIFSDNHPFVKGASRKAKKAVLYLLKENLPTPGKVVEKRFKSGGLIQIEGKQYKHEAEKNLKAYTFLAKYYGEKYRLLGVDNTSGTKNPDAVNLKTGECSEAKSNVTSPCILNAIQDGVKRASRANAAEVYFFLEKEYDMSDMRHALKMAFMKGRNKNIRTVIIKLHNEEVKRYDANMLRKIFK